MHSIFGKAMTPEEYSTEWVADSDTFKSANAYAWMREQLGDMNLVVEVGCGAGRSTLELARHSRVICLEPNEHMADVALSYLASSGISALIANELDDGSDHQVVILVADILEEDALEKLRGVRADAIACWLIGSEPGRIAHHLGRDLSSFSGGEMPEYREMIHRRCYSMGLEVLTPGGAVHVVDRLFIPSWNERDPARANLAQMHQEFAGSSYSVSLASTRFTRYTRPFTASNIQMMAEGDPRGHITVFGSSKAILHAGKV